MNGISVLNISIEHTLAVVRLPFHHRDPFDRMLIAQCLVENIPIISAHSKLDNYDIARLW